MARRITHGQSGSSNVGHGGNLSAGGGAGNFMPGVPGIHVTHGAPFSSGPTFPGGQTPGNPPILPNSKNEPSANAGVEMKRSTIMNARRKPKG